MQWLRQEFYDNAVPVVKEGPDLGWEEEMEDRSTFRIEGFCHQGLSLCLLSTVFLSLTVAEEGVAVVAATQEEEWERANQKVKGGPKGKEREEKGIIDAPID